MKDTANIVKQTRKVLGLTQKQFAELLGVKRGRVASYETSRSEPPGSLMLRIIELANNQRDAA